MEEKELAHIWNSGHPSVDLYPTWQEPHIVRKEIDLISYPVWGEIKEKFISTNKIKECCEKFIRMYENKEVFFDKPIILKQEGIDSLKNFLKYLENQV